MSSFLRISRCVSDCAKPMSEWREPMSEDLGISVNIFVRKHMDDAKLVTETFANTLGLFGKNLPQCADSTRTLKPAAYERNWLRQISIVADLWDSKWRNSVACCFPTEKLIFPFLLHRSIRRKRTATAFLGVSLFLNSWFLPSMGTGNRITNLILIIQNRFSNQIAGFRYLVSHVIRLRLRSIGRPDGNLTFSAQGRIFVTRGRNYRARQIFAFHDNFCVCCA